jgi:hypothetical protein
MKGATANNHQHASQSQRFKITENNVQCQQIRRTMRGQDGGDLSPKELYHFRSYLPNNIQCGGGGRPN